MGEKRDPDPCVPINAIGDGLVLLDMSGKVTAVNLAFEKTTRYEESEVVGKGAADVMQMLIKSKEDLEKIARDLKTALEGKTPPPRAYTFVTKDNREISITSTLSFIKNVKRKPSAVVFTFKDITKCERAEEALRESKEKYQKIFETTGTAMVIVEEDMTISLVNAEFEKLSGCSRDEVKGKRSWTEFVAKDDLGRMKEYHRLRRTDPNTAPKNYEFQFVDKQGNIKDIFLTIDMIPGTKKSIASLLDITERKRMEEEVQRVSRLNRKIVEDAPIGIITFDREGRIMQVNRRHLEIDRSKVMDPQKFIGYNIFEHPTVAKNGILNPLRKLLDGVSFDIEIDGFKTKTAEISVRIKGVPLTNEKGEIIGGLIMDEDITERKRAEKKLRESEKKFRDIFEELGYAIFIHHVDPENYGKILEVNPAAEKQTGYSRDELIGMSILDLVVGKTAVTSGESFDGKRVDFIQQKRRKNGDIYWVKVRNVPLKYHGGNVILSIQHDITELKRAEQERVKAAEARARAKEAEKHARELKRKIEQLEKFTRVTIGRELRMVELKERIRELESKLREASER